jgi:hypothetical protein
MKFITHPNQGICVKETGTLKRKLREDTKLRFYKVMMVVIILYGNEIWVSFLDVATLK